MTYLNIFRWVWARKARPDSNEKNESIKRRFPKHHLMLVREDS